MGDITNAAYITVLQPVPADHPLSDHLIERSGRSDGYRPSGVFVRVEECVGDSTVSGARQVIVSARIEGRMVNEFNTPVWVNERLPKGSLTLLWEASKMVVYAAMVDRMDQLMLSERDKTVVLKAKGI